MAIALQKGETLTAILADMEEVAEGINTLRISRAMANYLGLLLAGRRLEFLCRFELAKGVLQ